MVLIEKTKKIFTNIHICKTCLGTNLDHFRAPTTREVPDLESQNP